MKQLNENYDFDNADVLPLLVKEIFVEVMRDMKINDLFQCTFDADIHVAKVANNLNCPLLSYDGDFLLMDINCGVISCDLFDWENAFKLNQNYIECKLYKRTEFTRVLGLKPEMFAVFGSVLGNDFVNRDVFEEFVNNIRVNITDFNSQVWNQYHDRMHQMIVWLRTKINDKNAINDIYKYLKQRNHLNLFDSFTKSIKSYQLNDNYSYLLELICFGENRDDIKNLVFYDEAVSTLPKWFLYEFHTMKISSTLLMAIITKSSVHFRAQIEDFSMNSSYDCCNKLYHILSSLTRLSDNKLNPLTVYSRKRYDIFKYEIMPTLYLSDGTEIPNLMKIRDFDINQRKVFILKLVCLDEEFVNRFCSSLLNDNLDLTENDIEFWCL